MLRGCARTRCSRSGWPRIKANGVFRLGRPHTSLPVSLPLVIILPRCRSISHRSQPRRSPTHPVALPSIVTNRQSYAPVTTAPQSSAVGCWMPFYPSYFQPFLAHEQRQFSRLTQPGSVFRHFHEKGRVVRLRRDASC